MFHAQVWSGADVDALPGEVRSIKLHRIDPAVIAALNRRVSLPQIDLADGDLDDEQLALLSGVRGLVALDVMGTAGISDDGLRSILALKGLRELGILSNGGGLSEIGLASIGECPTIESLVLDNSRSVTDPVIAAIGRLRRLTYLSLEVWESSEAAFSSLCDMPALRGLQVLAPPTDVDHAPLLGHEELTTLRLYGNQNTTEEADRIVKQLWGLPKLAELLLAGYPASDSSYTGLNRLETLRSLSLGANRRLGDVAAKSISELPHLIELGLQRTAIADAGVESLSALPRLKNLSLFECPRITGAGVLHLTKTRPIENLDLKGCRNVAMSDAERLAEQLPDCLIRLPDGSRSWSDERIKECRERLMEESRRPTQQD